MAYFECLVGGSGDGSTLTVTCYSGFAGLTISITNGVDTFSDVCPSTSPYEVVFEGLANGTWTLSTVYNGVTYTETVEIDIRTQFYPIPNGETATPTDDIQTWLFCASIFDKNYTTISQVLADTTTLLALISSNNAADYMARSTSWASAVCANQTAMGYIGNDNYCANKLLSNSTWHSAIVNSTYFESVLNVKVPTMTSNTTPSGVASASTSLNNTYAPYKAFSSSGNWYPNRYGSNMVGEYIQYEFTTPITLGAVRTRWGSDGGATLDSTWTVLGSNDGFVSDINVIQDITLQVSPFDTLHSIISSTPYKYIRLRCKTNPQPSSGHYYGLIYGTNFYGRN